MPKVNKAPLTLSLCFSPSLSLALLSHSFSLPPTTLSLLLSSFMPTPSIHLTLLLSPSLSLISPLQPFSGLYREGSNLRFILPSISNLKDPRCWRRIFSGLDVSRPVKLKSVKKKNGQNFQWLPVFMAPPDRNASGFSYTELYAWLINIIYQIWFSAWRFEIRDIVKQQYSNIW